MNITRTGDAALAHTTGNDGGMRRHSTACGQNSACRIHATNILGAGFGTAQNHLLALGSLLLRLFRRKDDFTRRRTGRCGQANSQLGRLGL